jgi:site-specific DNA-cytosine methylase
LKVLEGFAGPGKPSESSISRPRGLGLFGGAGGADMGYWRAGFDMVGVDTNPQPNYPFEFIQADALDVLQDHDFLAQFDAILASPICQGWTAVTDWRGSRANYPDLLTPTVELLGQVEIPWVVENAPEAAAAGVLRADYRLCGTQFGLRVKRHRVFQVGNWTPPFELLPPCYCYRRPDLIAFEHKDERAFADAMGCTWMNNLEARQAIPPAYTEYIGGHLVAELARAAA